MSERETVVHSWPAGWDIVRRTYPDGSYELLAGKYTPRRYGAPWFWAAREEHLPKYVRAKLKRLRQQKATP